MRLEFEQGTPARGLSLQLNTFADLQEKGSALSECVKRARPLVERPFMRWADGRQLRFDQAFGYWIGMGGEDLNGNEITLDWSERNWDYFVHELAGGRLRTFRFLGHFNDGLGLPESEVGGFLVEVDLAGVEFEGAAHALVVTVGRPLLGAILDPRLESSWTQEAKQAALVLDAATGFLTIDHAGPRESPYEASIGRYWLTGRRQCRELLRGYYWGNFLWTWTHRAPRWYGANQARCALRSRRGPFDQARTLSLCAAQFEHRRLLRPRAS